MQKITVKCIFRISEGTGSSECHAYYDFTHQSYDFYLFTVQFFFKYRLKEADKKKNPHNSQT